MDFAWAAVRVHGSAAAHLPQHAALLLKEAAALPWTSPAGLGPRNKAQGCA